MFPARFRSFPGLCRLRRLASCLGTAGLTAVALGCTLPMSALLEQGPPGPATPALALRPAPAAIPAPAITAVAFFQGPELPAPAAVVADPPLSFDGVLRMADEKNAQIARARVSVKEAETAQAVAESSCLPDRLRQEPFRRNYAEAHTWQQRVELSKVRAEVLQDAGSAYVDWLTAVRGEAITAELQDYEQKLLKRTRALAKDEKSAESLVQTLESTVAGRQHAAARLRQQAEAAAEKLAYLLNSDHGVPVPGGAVLALVDLADATQPAEALVQQSQVNGPGVQELQGLQAAVEKTLDKTRPLQIACNLTGSCKYCGRVKYVELKVDEVRVAREDQAGKLRLGVLEARSAILSGRDQIGRASDQIRHAAEAYRLGNIRLDDMLTAGTLGDVIQSIRLLDAAHFGYLQAVAAYDKAEVRLLILLGLPHGGKPHP
jgi:outer membrane protein TolC